MSNCQKQDVLQGCWIGVSMTFVPSPFKRGTPLFFLGMSSTSEGYTAHKIPYFTDLSWKIYDLKFVLLDSRHPSAMTKSKALQSNLDVDYVISYRFAKSGTRHLTTLKAKLKLTTTQTRLKLPLNSKSFARLLQTWVCRRKLATEITTRCCSL